MTAEREVRVTVHAPEHLTLTEIAEMFWDKLYPPDAVFEVCAIAVSSAPSCTDEPWLPGLACDRMLTTLDRGDEDEDEEGTA